MKRFKKILVVTDTRLDHPLALHKATEIARHNRASLKIVDVVPEFSPIVKLTLRNHEHMRRLVEDDKRDRLETLAAPIRDQGISVATKVLSGRTSIEVIREVVRGGHDLLLRVTKGPDSRRSGSFGNTAIGLLRRCPCAVWLLTPDKQPAAANVLGCVDTSAENPLDEELNDKVFELASSIGRHHGGRFSIVHAWWVFAERIVQGRMKEVDFKQFLKLKEDEAREALDRFLRRHRSKAKAENVHLVKGQVADVVADFVKKQRIDLVVMGTVARSGVSGFLMGNTAEEIIDRISCSVLAVKPSSFVCPVPLD